MGDNEKILNGKIIAARMREEIRQKSLTLAERGIIPGLAVVLVGEDPASVSYVTAKERACAEAGMYSLDRRLPENTRQEELLALIADLNRDPRIHGILVQLPLPGHMDQQKVLLAVSPEKDVDGFHPLNLGKMFLGQESFYPCTPYGIVKILEYSGVDTRGSHVVILGRSATVGKSLANLLLSKGPGGDATVTVCHSRTPDLGEHTRRGDILVAAVGQAGLVGASMVKEGAVVIDVGISRVPDPGKKSGFRLQGDVNFDEVLPRVSKITPVPGGVGPMTITMLLYNTLRAARRARGEA